MRVTIPLEEVIAECMKEPGFAEAREQARRELDEEIAMYGTIGNPQPAPRLVFARSKPKNAREFSARLRRAHATA